MKITVKSSLLKGAISNLESLFASALDSWDMEILISTEGNDKIILECSGGGGYYKQIIPAVVDKKGKVAVNVEMMKNLNFPGETVTFLVKNKAMSFASGRMTGKLESIGETDPVVRPKSFKEDDALILPSKLFTRLVSSILFTPTVADAAMKMRFVANGKKQRLKVFSVDQYRLSRYEWRKPEEGEEEQMAPKETTKKKKGAKPAKEKKEAPREVMVAEVKGDFDYVFSSSFLSAVKGFFTGSLRIAADSKLVRMADENITLYCPSLQEDIGANTDAFIKEQEGKDPTMALTFHPGHAEDLIDAACSVNKNDDNRITMIPIPKEKQMQVRVTGDGVKTQCTFDVLSIKAESDTRVVLNSAYFLEFLGLVRGFADEKKGCGMKVWEKCVVLHTKDSLYMMPTTQ